MSNSPTQITKISVGAKGDHLEQYTKAATPYSAVAELVWNAFDADADTVEIEIELNRMNSVQGLRVKDNGTGIPLGLSKDAFGNLGGSWKARNTVTSKSARNLHGKTGFFRENSGKKSFFRKGNL